MSSLTLSRTAGEAITIYHGDDQLTLYVDEIRGNQVKINFHAPESFEIFRDELLECENE